MSYSRANPSPRYLELQELYRSLHSEGESLLGIKPEDQYPGNSLMPQVHRIKALVDRTGAQTVLDYGSGKGRQYDAVPLRDAAGNEYPGVLDYWNIDEVRCYDPGYPPYSKYPEGNFDGVICTDVLEHCPEEDIPWILDELFGFASRFVFANVASYPALQRLPNGENAHCTIKPTAWWRDLFKRAAARHAGVRWEVWIASMADTQSGRKLVEEKIAGD